LRRQSTADDKFGARDVCGLWRFGETTADILLYGHTHQPVVQRARNTLVVSPGSTGEPRITDGGEELSCAVLDITHTDARIIRFSL
jgi:predicted phosphodiesterase